MDGAKHRVVATAYEADWSYHLQLVPVTRDLTKQSGTSIELRFVTAEALKAEVDAIKADLDKAVREVYG